MEMFGNAGEGSGAGGGRGTRTESAPGESVGHSVVSTLCNPMHCSPLGSSVHGIFQARIMEWVAMPSLPGDLPDSGIELGSPLRADSLLSEPPGKAT